MPEKRDVAMNDGFRVQAMLRINDGLQYCGECLEPRGQVTPQGYKIVNIGHKAWRAHRLAYLLWVGPLDPELCIDHLCRNKKCSNPSHLEQVSFRENTLRSENLGVQNSRKTACLLGHPYAQKLNAKGGRWCPTCNAAECRKRRAAKQKRPA